MLSMPKLPTTDPEVASTPAFGASVRAARKARGLNQTQLARSISPPTSQATISAIEKGVGDDGQPVSSSAVLAICRYLRIAPPIQGLSPALERWLAIGYALEAQGEVLAYHTDMLERVVGVERGADIRSGAERPGRPARH